MKLLPGSTMTESTHRFSTFTTIFGYLEGVGSYKNTMYQKVCVALRLICMILACRDIISSRSLAIEMGSHFFRAITTKRVLSYSVIINISRKIIFCLLKYHNDYMFTLCHFWWFSQQLNFAS